MVRHVARDYLDRRTFAASKWRKTSLESSIARRYASRRCSSDTAPFLDQDPTFSGTELCPNSLWTMWGGLWGKSQQTRDGFGTVDHNFALATSVRAVNSPKSTLTPNLKTKHGRSTIEIWHTNYTGYNPYYGHVVWLLYLSIQHSRPRLQPSSSRRLHEALPRRTFTETI